MNITKDTYEYLTNFADDRDIISMLSVNKKFSDDTFFERVLKRKYPFLLKFRKENESFKKLYLRIVRYIAKLQEEFKIPYIPSSTFNPEDFYNRFRSNPEIISHAASYAATIGNVKIVNDLIEKGADKLHWILIEASFNGHIDLVKDMIRRGAFASVDYLVFYNAAMGGHIDLLKFLIEKGFSNQRLLNIAMRTAVKTGNVNVQSYLEQQGAKNSYIFG